MNKLKALNYLIWMGISLLEVGGIGAASWLSRAVFKSDSLGLVFSLVLLGYGLSLWFTAKQKDNRHFLLVLVLGGGLLGFIGGVWAIYHFFHWKGTVIAVLANTLLLANVFDLTSPAPSSEEL